MKLKNISFKFKVSGTDEMLAQLKVVKEAIDKLNLMTLTVEADHDSEEKHSQIQLTEQEITILKGRLAEGYETICRADGGFLLFIEFPQEESLTNPCVDNHLFQFIKRGEEYSITELLEGANNGK